RVPLDDRLDWSALGTLFTLTLRQHLRGFRFVLICLLFALPTLIVVLIRLADPHPSNPRELEIGMPLTLLPMALVPLAALLYASGMIRDEIEEQTLTYLLVRPLPRRALHHETAGDVSAGRRAGGTLRGDYHDRRPLGLAGILGRDPT